MPTIGFQDEHQARFKALLARLGLREPITQQLWTAIDRAYGEPHRAYHTSEHVKAMLALFDSDWFQENCPIRGSNPQLFRDEVEVAIWWHDAVYQTTISAPGLSNEEASACWAYYALLSNGAPIATASTVYDLVLATNHNYRPATPLAPWIADLDLAILGADKENFKLYDGMIAAEYGHVFYPDYLRGRVEFLRQFLLSREYVYCTLPFRERYETTARNNIENLIIELTFELKELGYD